MTKTWKKLFSNKNFLYIWLSQIFSQITLNILNFIILFTLFENTGSSIATSMVWISYALPAVFIGPFASASVDLFDRKKVLYVTNFLQSILVLIYGLSNHTSNYYVYVLVIIYSSINQFYVPAELSTIPFVVDKKYLPEANSISLITQQASLILGFAVAGIFLNLLGQKNTYTLCAIFLFIAFLSTLFLPKMKPKQSIPSKFENTVILYLKKIYSGYIFIKQNRYVLAPLFIMTFMQISLSVIAVNIPALADEVLKVPLNIVGLLIIMPAGLGAVAASLVFSKLLRNKMRKIRIIKWSLAGLVISLFLWIFIFSGFQIYLKFIFSIISIFTIGFCYIGVLIPTQTFLQQKTPFEFRGRVFGNYWFLVTVASVFPVIASGTITEILGVKILVALIILCIMSLFYFLNNSERKYLTGKGFN